VVKGRSFGKKGWEREGGGGIGNPKALLPEKPRNNGEGGLSQGGENPVRPFMEPFEGKWRPGAVPDQPL
jgi:hypothetical protein